MSKKRLPPNIRMKANGVYEARKTYKGKMICLSNTNLDKLLEDFEQAKAAAENNILTSQNLTLNEWFEEWFQLYKVPVIKESSIYPMKMKYTKTFGNKIGMMKLTEIKNIHIQRALKDLKEEGKAVSSLKEAVGRLKECLESAKNNQLIHLNPCFDIVVPWKNKEVHRRFLSIDEQNRFLEAAKSDFPWYYPMFMIMFQTGLRIGEVGGLKWDDIDWEQKTIFVKRAMMCQYEDGIKTLKLTSTKTINSVREIPFLGNTEEMLRLQKMQQDKVKKSLGSRWRSSEEDFSNLVFTTTMGSPATRYIVEKVINKVVGVINLQENVTSVKENRSPVLMDPVHPHAIRRTFCTRCFEANMNPKAVQKLMGHATYSTTIDIYTEVMKDKMDFETGKFKLGYEEAE